MTRRLAITLLAAATSLAVAGQALAADGKPAANPVLGQLMAGADAGGPPARRDIAIATGQVVGVYYPAGGALCATLNQAAADHGLRCTVLPTAGSVDNLRRLRAGGVAFAIVQSDWQFHAVNGTAAFAEDGPFAELRAVLALYAEPLSVVVRGDSAITSFADLKGKRVNVGRPGSGRRAIMEALVAARGGRMDDFALAAELDAAAQAPALCDDRVDAIAFTVGHPSGSLAAALARCGGPLVGFADATIDRLTVERPYYRRATIAGGTYRGNPGDVATFGVGATLVTTADVGEDVVHALVRSVFADLAAFRRRHPTLADVNAETMINAGLTAPLHRGAARYFAEAGMM